MTFHHGKNARKLLFRPAKKADECLASYFIRIAEGNGFAHAGHLLNYAGLNWKNNRAPIYQIISGQFDVAPLLGTLGLAKYQSNLAEVYQSFQRGIDSPYILAKYPRVCPQCLDEERYCKEHWALLPVVVCTRHKCVLVDQSRITGKKLGWYRQHLNQFDGEGKPIKKSEAKARSSLVQQCLHIEALLSGKQPSSSGPAVLMGLGLREMLSLIHFIAHYQSRLLTGSFHPTGMQSYQLSYIYDTVWTALKDWPDSFYSLLSQYVDRPMVSKGQAGLSKHFRDLYERLCQQKENRGIARIKVEFDRYIEEYWPGVLAPERITRIHLVSGTRNIISKKEAASILGSRIARIDKLVQQGRIKPIVFKGKAHYQRDNIEALAREMTSNWTMAEACKALEITRYQLKQLLDSEVIPTLQKPDSLNRDWIIDKKGCLDLISTLRSNARKSEPPMGALSMAGAQRQGYSIVRLILSMLSGKLQYSVDAEVDCESSIKKFSSFCASPRIIDIDSEQL